MPRSRQLFSDFSGGEVSPRIDTRADLERYGNACRLVENWMLAKQGGILMRRGTQHIGAMGDVVRLIPYRADDGGFLFEVRTSALRGWTNAGPIMAPGPTPYEVSLGIAFTQSSFRYAQRGNEVALATFNGPPRLVRVNATDSWTVTLIPFSRVPVAVFNDQYSPPRQDAVYDVTFNGFADGNTFNVYVDGEAIMPTFAEARIMVSGRSSIGESVLAGLRATKEPQRFTYSTTVARTEASLLKAIQKSPSVKNKTDVTVVWQSGTTYRVTMSGEAGGLSLSVAAAAETDTRHISMTTNAAGRFGEEPAWSFPTVVLYSGTYYLCKQAHISQGGGANTPNNRADLWDPLPGAPSYESWQPSPTWSASSISYGVGGRPFPDVCAFYDQRLILAKGATLWASALGDPTDFRLGPEPDQAWSREIDADNAPVVRWLASNNGLVVGTSGGIWVLSANGTLTPADVNARRHSADRCSNQPAVVVGNEVIFTGQARRQLSAFRFNSLNGPFETLEISALAEHLARYRIARVFYAHHPQPVIYCLTDHPGLVLAIAYSRQDSKIGFQRITINGTIQDGAVLSSDADGDVLWLAIRRGSVTALERLLFPVVGPPTDSPSLTATRHLDGWVVRNEQVGGLLTNLGHLEGRTVTILTSDGTIFGTRTVTGGQVTATGVGAGALVGEAFTARAETVEPAQGNPQGVGTGTKKRWSDLVARLYQSAAPKINGERPIMGALPASALRSGEARITTLGWRDGAIVIEQDLPYPTEVVGLYGDLSVSTGG